MAARPPVGLPAGALLLLAGLLASTSASAFECTPARLGDAFRCHVALHWEERTIPYVVQLPAGTQTDRTLLLGAVEAATRHWSAPQCTDLAFEDRGTVAEDPGALHQILIRPVPTGWEHHRGVVALTSAIHGFDTGKISTVLLELNEENFSFVDASGACTNEFDLEATLTHELGHAIGFAHPCEQGADALKGCGSEVCDVVLERLLAADPSGRLPTMWPTVTSCDVELRSLEADDLDGVCFVYPAAGLTRPCRPLPDQSEGFVRNQAFGCRAAPGDPNSGAWGAALLLGLGLTLRRRLGRFRP